MVDAYNEIDHIFFSDGFKLASSILDKVDKVKIETLTGRLYKEVDNLIKSFIDRLSREKLAPACVRGCNYCCSQAVFVNPREVSYLQSYISKFSDSKIKSEIRIRAKEKNNLSMKMGMKDILKLKHPCPLLHNNECIAYDARPMACRIYLSMKLKSCLDFFHKPDNKLTFPQLYEFPLHMGRMLNEGVESFLSEKGLNSDSMTIEMGLDMALSNTDFTELWISGSDKTSKRKWSEKDLEALKQFEQNF